MSKYHSTFQKKKKFCNSISRAVGKIKQASQRDASSSLDRKLIFISNPHYLMPTYKQSE